MHYHVCFFFSPFIFQFPEFIASFFARLSLPSMGSTPAAPSRNVLGNVPSYAGRQMEASLLADIYRFGIYITIHAMHQCITHSQTWSTDYRPGSGRDDLEESCNDGFFYIVVDVLTRNYPAPLSATVEPSEDSIATLVSMGFDRNASRQALIHARNDVNAATNALLESQSHLQ
ncbi:unnamed protein product [Ilex paraguariensis]|uniref:UBA domain-containing protein n=1 Tax=Ilex paraguariensis TaxID=185542 RepID=A0ABC8USM6_9AQUA